MQKNSCLTRLLSIVLSLLMALSCFGILRGTVVTAYAAGSGSVSDAMWNALADALRSENVKNAAFTGTNDVKVNDPSGDVYAAATAYYAILNAYIFKATGNSGSSAEAGYDYRTSSQVRDLVKTKMSSVMGSDYTTYNAANVIQNLGGNVTVSGDTNTTQNSVPKTTVKVTVVRLQTITRYATFAELAAAHDASTYSYTINHTNTRRYSTSGCGAKTYYYCTCSSTSADEGTADVNIDALTAYNTVLVNNASVLDADQAAQIDMGYDALTGVYNAITGAKNTAAAAFSDYVVGHFFSSYDAKIDAIEASMKIAQFKPIVDRINGYVGTDITDYTLAQLTTIHANFETDYNSYKNIGIDEVYTYFETDNNILERDVVDAKYAEIENAYQIAYLRENVKPVITAAVATYLTYNDDWVLATENAESEINAAKIAVEGYIETLGTYKSDNVDIVFGAGYKTNVLYPLVAEMDRLLEVNEYKVLFEGFKTVYTTAFEPVDPSYTTEQLYSLLSEKDEWYTQLQDYVDAVREYNPILAIKILGELEPAMEVKIDSVYALLNERLTATINNAYDLYHGFVAEYGYTIDTSNDVTVSNYRALQTAFGQLNPTHYAFLSSTAHFTIPAETVAKYEEIKNAVFAFANFDASKGLSAYAYNHQEIADIIRAVSAADVARNADYDVTDEKVEAIIDMLEGLLSSDTIKESFDLSGTLTGVLDNLYTDDFLNTLMQYVYPMVAFEFAKVWAGLPTELKGVETGNTTAPTADITLSLNNMPTALNKLGLYLLPNLLAQSIDGTAYPDVKSKLSAVPSTVSAVKEGEEWVWGTNPWENANIYDAETGKLTLEWGITDKESFLQAASAALSGVAPLLLALLSKVETTKQANIGTGTGTSPDCSAVRITVDRIDLTMTFGGNPGYNNMLAPILTALGANNLPNGNTLTSVRAVLEDGVIGPVEQILSGIANKPLDSILKLLPTIAFAFNLNLVAPLMNELKTSIAYDADAHYTYEAKVLGFTVASGEGASEDAMADSLDINLGEMIDLAGMGIDLTSMNGLLQSVIGLLTKPDEEAAEGDEPVEPAPAFTLPPIDAATLSMLGTDVEWISGYRTSSPFAGVEGHATDYARITVGNRADVFLFLIDYLFQGIDQYDLVDNIINLINSGKAEGEDPIALSEDILNIIDTAAADKDNVIAAVVELLFPQRYSMDDIRKIDWITEGNFLEDNYANWTAETAAEYNSLWTREDALYVESHIEDVLNYLVALFGEQLGGAKTIPAAAEALIGGLFTAENANKIPEALKGLLGGLELPEMVADLGLFEQLGIDLTAWDNMTFTFEDGDKDAFKAALITALNPLESILGFILAEKDVTLTLLDQIPVTALGYDGYSFGIVPLLEALGATGVKSTADFKVDTDNIVKNIIDPLFTVIDSLVADPLAFIQTVLPNIVYFNKCGGIQTAVPNLLFAINVLLDTIRPVYDINIYQLVEENLGFDIRFLESDPIDFLLSTVAGIVEDSAGITLSLDFSADDICDTLHFSDPESFTSANGSTAYKIALSADGRADLLTRTLDFIILQVVYEDNYDMITETVAGLFGGDGVPEIFTEILTNFKNNYNESLLAIFHLLFPERVEMNAPKIQWITEGNIGADEDTYIGTAIPEGDTTLWTLDKAVYTTEHLSDFINDLIVIFGEQLGGAENLGEAVDYLAKSILTAENANKIVDAIRGLVGNLGIPDTILDVAKQLGIDLRAWDNMSFSFSDGDKSAFKSALISALKPVEPVLRMILVEGGDLEATVFDAIPITLLGYDGYSYGIVPLFEALGCTGIKSTAQFKADKAHVVENLVNPLFTAVDHLIANPLKFIEDVIPALIYFDKVQGIQVAIPNLLFAINVILDTIRPIYDIDIYELVEEKTGVDLHFAEESPIDFLLTKISEVIKEKTDIELKIDFTVETLSETLHFTDPIKFSSANGDDAYTIKLTQQGKADLLTHVLDYAVNQVIFEDNFDKLVEMAKGLIEDDDTRAILIGILRIIKDADNDIADFHGVHDVALASLFWVFFGADSVTDAVSDFFYRFKDAEWYEIIFMVTENAPEYVDRAAFLLRETYNVEYPAFMKIVEERERLLKPPYEYDEEETQMAAGIGARIIRFFALIIAFFKNLFKR